MSRPALQETLRAFRNSCIQHAQRSSAHLRATPELHATILGTDDINLIAARGSFDGLASLDFKDVLAFPDWTECADRRVEVAVERAERASDIDAIAFSLVSRRGGGLALLAVDTRSALRVAVLGVGCVLAGGTREV